MVGFGLFGDSFGWKCKRPRVDLIGSQGHRSRLFKDLCQRRPKWRDPRRRRGRQREERGPGGTGRLAMDLGLDGGHGLLREDELVGGLVEAPLRSFVRSLVALSVRRAASCWRARPRLPGAGP